MDCFTTATATAMLVWPNLVLSHATFYVFISAKAQFCIHCSQSPNKCGVFLSGFKQSAIIISLSGDLLPKIWHKASRIAWAFESKTCAMATEANHVFAVAAQLMRVQKAVHGAVPVSFWWKCIVCKMQLQQQLNSSPQHWPCRLFNDALPLKCLLTHMNTEVPIGGTNCMASSHSCPKNSKNILRSMLWANIMHVHICALCYRFVALKGRPCTQAFMQ